MFIAALRKGVMFGSSSCYAWPVVNRFIDILPEPLSEGQVPWPTDLKPWIEDSVSRFKLRGSRLVDAETGLLGLVARTGASWLEGASYGVL